MLTCTAVKIAVTEYGRPKGEAVTVGRTNSEHYHLILHCQVLVSLRLAFYLFLSAIHPKSFMGSWHYQEADAMSEA
jgi:hypothetical protein